MSTVLCFGIRQVYTPYNRIANKYYLRKQPKVLPQKVFRLTQKLQSFKTMSNFTLIRTSVITIAQF